MEDVFSIPEVQTKPPPEAKAKPKSEPVDDTSFRDTLDKKVQDASVEKQKKDEQASEDELLAEAQKAAAQLQQQIITVSNHFYDELVTPEGEIQAEGLLSLQDSLMVSSDNPDQLIPFDTEDLAVVSEDVQMEKMLENDVIPEGVKFSEEFSEDIVSIELDMEPVPETNAQNTGGQVIEVEQTNVQAELQNAENALEDTGSSELDFNIDDIDSIDTGRTDLTGIDLDEIVESDRMAETLLPRIINRIIDAAKSQSGKETKSLHIQLHPEELGKISVRITMKDDGVHISLAADSNATSKMLQENTTALKQALAGAGVDLSGFDMGQETFKQQEGKKLSNSSATRIHLINDTALPAEISSNYNSANSSSGLDYRI